MDTEKRITPAGHILVVTTSARMESDGLQAMREYIVESLGLGVLVLSQGMEYRVAELPALGGVYVQRLEAGLRGHDLPPPEKQPAKRTPRSKSAPPEAPETPKSEREEKNQIADRLRAYRRAHGLGCLTPLAEACGVSADTLRGLLNGSITAELQTWREVGRALDKAEEPAP